MSTTDDGGAKYAEVMIGGDIHTAKRRLAALDALVAPPGSAAPLATRPLSDHELGAMMEDARRAILAGHMAPLRPEPPSRRTKKRERNAARRART